MKKEFCINPNGSVFKKKKMKFCSKISMMVEPIERWINSDNVENLRLSDRSNHETFHRSIYPLMIVAQFFGVMPLKLGSPKNPLGLRFTMKSFGFVFAIAAAASCGVEAIFSIAWTFKTRIEFGKLVILVYYITNFLSFVCFIRLAKVWPELMLRWHEVETKLPMGEFNPKKLGMCSRIRRTACVILCLSAIEHILSIVSSVASVIDCPKIKSILQAYYVHNFPQVFSFFGYSHALGVYVKIIHVTSTFVWSYADLFIIMISCGLAAKFRQVNDQMVKNKGKLMDSDYWAEYRKYYRSVCDLVALVDEKVDHILILSISNNLFFICVQLLNSVDYMSSFAQGFYFWFSLIYLIIRTVAVSLTAAEINDESKRPIEILRAIPRTGWCLEIKRFTDEVNHDIVALSGKKFFFLTRGFLISVAGTIITYELVLIQFQTNDNISDYDPCNRNVTTLF